MNAVQKIIRNSQLKVPVGLLVTVLVMSLVVPPIFGRSSGISYGLYSSVQQFAIYGLVCVGVGLVLLMGHFDVGVLGLWPLASVIALKTGDDNVIVGIVVAGLCGLLIGLVHGGIVALTGISGLVVTFASAIAMSGLAGLITDELSISSNNFELGVRLSEQIAVFFSWHAFIVGLIVAGVVFLVVRSRLGAEILATGGDPRASRTAGVRVDLLTVLVFGASGTLIAVAAALTAHVQAFADPAPAWTPTMFGLTAVLLGGLGLHGGEGSLIGVILGALTLSTLQALFVTLHTELWVPVVAQGLVLVAIAVATSPVLARRRTQAGAERSRSAPRPAKVG